MKVISILVVLFLAILAEGVEYHFSPNATFARDLNALCPYLIGGDRVIFHASSPGGSSTYDFQSFGGTYTFKGQPNEPIIWTNNPGDAIIFTTSNPNYNVIQLAGSYWVFEGFEIIGDSRAQHSLALRLMSGTNHVVVQNLKVHDLYQNAITANMNGATYTNLTFRGNEIWNTADTGECLYLGCQGSVTTTPCKVIDSLVELNYCHDTCGGVGGCPSGAGSEGSGFQIKFGSYNNIVRNNVCYKVNTPCVLLYDDWDLGANLVEGNYILNTVSDSAIQVSAGAVIRNNIIVGSGRDGITISNNNNNIYNNLGTRNVHILHNTIVDNAGYGIAMSVTPTRTMLINNALGLNANGDFRADASQSGVEWRNNGYVDSRLPPNIPTGGVFQMSSAAAFGINWYPNADGPLIGAGYDSELGYDFNYNPRRACTSAVGAYEFSTKTNPGWTLATERKIVTGSVAPCTIPHPCRLACTSNTESVPVGTSEASTGNSPNNEASSLSPIIILVFVGILPFNKLLK